MDGRLPLWNAAYQQGNRVLNVCVCSSLCFEAELVRTATPLLSPVFPAQAGIQARLFGGGMMVAEKHLDSSFRWNDMRGFTFVVCPVPYTKN